MTEARGGTVTIELPGALRDLSGGRPTIELEGEHGTVREALAALRRENTAIYDRLVTERGEVRTHVNLFVEGAEIRTAGGLDTPLGGTARILVVPAVSGG